MEFTYFFVSNERYHHFQVNLKLISLPVKAMNECRSTALVIGKVLQHKQ